VARERVEKKNRESDAGDTPEEQPEAGPEGPPAGSPAGKPGSKPGSRSAGDSGTAAAAAQARSVMQRRHRRLGFAMTAAVGVEVAGAAGLVLAGLLPWEWGERLWGRTDTGGLVLQVAIAATVLGLLPGWLPARSARADRLRPGARTVALLPAAVVLVGAVAVVWQAPTGGRGSGGVVAALAAVLVLAGAAGWLVGLRRLRVLFPFGLQEARVGGYGNLPAVRRAMLIGGPAGAAGGIAMIAGALLVVPGLVTTEDAQTAGALVLAGDPPAVGDAAAWQLRLPASDSATIRATTGGLVVEERRGVRVVDPRDGTGRWHWRDSAYQRTASVVTDRGGTIVLALGYDGGQAGRDRVVALDTATGEVRWDRYDAELVEAMGLVAVAPAEGDWFVVPEQGVAPQGQPAPVTLRAVGSDGGTRWRAGEDQGCSLTAVSADANTVVVTGQECTGQEGEEATGGGCRVTGLDPATGDPAWSWPPADREPVAGCQPSPRPGLVFVSYQAGSESATVALDPDTGAEVWSATGDAAAGLNNPVVAGDTVLGVRRADDGAGGLLVLRDAADGEVRDEVGLPAGQPVGIMPLREGSAVISHYRPDSAEVVLLEVDVATGTVSSETVVAAAPDGAAFQRVSVAVGPQTLAMDALLAAGPEPAPEDLTLLVYGFG
jgi:outer membrane protein assembly factor BamB